MTIFGSARTGPEEPIYQKCVTFARQLNRLGYMVITGGGPGIMQAGNEGAGPENSFAVNIRLPFEQETNPVMENSRNVIFYKYFFNRKVAFPQGSPCRRALPRWLRHPRRGDGDADPGANRQEPADPAGADRRRRWQLLGTVVRIHPHTLLTRGLISGEDFGLFTITRDPFEAAQVINDFYRVYHSSRFVGKTLVIRLNKSLQPNRSAPSRRSSPKSSNRGAPWP